MSRFQISKNLVNYFRRKLFSDLVSPCSYSLLNSAYSIPITNDFIIKRVTPKDNEQIWELMRTTFLKEDPLCQYLHIWNDPKSECLKEIVSNELALGLSLKAVTNCEENKLVGCCINTKVCPWDYKLFERKFNSIKSENIQKLLRTWQIISLSSKIHEKFKLPQYYEISFLCVDSQYQKQGIAKQLVKTSLYTARDQGYSAVVMDCTSEHSTKTAMRSGMKLLKSIPYSSLGIVPKDPHRNANVFVANFRENLSLFSL